MKKVELIIVLYIIYSVVKDDKMLITLKNDMFGCFMTEENVTKTMKQV